MIRVFTNNKQFIEPETVDKMPECLDNYIWVDLHNPTDEEIKEVEKDLNIILPTKKEMYGLEASSRLYQENYNYFMTIFVIANSETPKPEIQPITFIMVGDKLVTVRYVDPHPFQAFISRKERVTSLKLDGKDILINLLENIIERISDILVSYGHKVDELSMKVFKPSSKILAKGKKSINYEKILKDIGRSGDLVSKSRESLVTISRLVTYIGQNEKFQESHDEAIRIEILETDVKSLRDYATFITNKINFLLEATLGMINIQQNNIIKIFTVATMMFLPPTLIASIYGMNFEYLPDLHLQYGYYMALLLMGLSAYIPFKIFKKRGWL